MGFTIENQVFTLPPKRSIENAPAPVFSHKHLWFPADQTRFLQYLPLQNKLLGKGAYGHVCAVTNSENGERLAVKKVKNAFDDVIDAKRVLREI
eukprot:1737019-Rhodomonas_salina.1